MNDSITVAVSAIQHYAYCPRQFSLIHVEQIWQDNRYTAEGLLLHARVDGGEPEQRGHIRYERSVLIHSQTLGLQGKLDLLEIDSNFTPPSLTPVEYKRGKPKVQSWDRMQVCAQALCLEEMCNTSVGEGAIWYWETRHRETVILDDALRRETKSAIESARHLIRKGITPPPTEHRKRCKACSLNEQCQPNTIRQDQSLDYMKELFRT